MDIAKPWCITEECDNLLKKLSFTLVTAWDGGMRKHYIWMNTLVSVNFFYDRGYFDCFVGPVAPAHSSADLISLLRFLKNDRNFYVKELEDAALYNTLEVDGYVRLLVDNYDLVSHFIANFDSVTFDNYRKFVSG